MQNNFHSMTRFNQTENLKYNANEETIDPTQGVS